MGINTFEDSRIWQAALQLAVRVYKLTAQLPDSEKYGITSQLNRASVSVSTNIAEGFGRTGKKEKIQFYNIAYGSLVETKSLLLLSSELGFFKKSAIENQLEEIVSLQKQLNATKSAVKERSS